jgi:hypothetical protein
VKWPIGYFWMPRIEYAAGRGPTSPRPVYARRVAETQRRHVPLTPGTEVETALMFLDFQREAMVIKCEGLDEEQLRTVLVPTGTNLLGLVQHLTVGERYWFAHHVAGELDDEKWDFTMDVPTGVRVDEVFTRYREAIAHSNEIIRRVGDPEALTARPVHGTPLPLRWVLGHNVTEVARHVGHADIIREQLDGATGR